jgi:hypothetical protein
MAAKTIAVMLQQLITCFLLSELRIVGRHPRGPQAVSHIVCHIETHDRCDPCDTCFVPARPLLIGGEWAITTSGGEWAPSSKSEGPSHSLSVTSRCDRSDKPAHFQHFVFRINDDLHQRVRSQTP